MDVNIYYFQFVPETENMKAKIVKFQQDGSKVDVCNLEFKDSKWTVTDNPCYEVIIYDGFDVRDHDRVEIIGDRHFLVPNGVDVENSIKCKVNRRVIIPFRYFCAKRKEEDILDIYKYYGPHAINQFVTMIYQKGSIWVSTNDYIISSGEPSQGVVDIDENIKSISFPRVRGGRKSRRSIRKKRRRTRRRKHSK